MKALLTSVESNQDSRGTIILVYGSEGFKRAEVLNMIKKVVLKKAHAYVDDAESMRLSKLDLEEDVTHKFRIRSGLAVCLSFTLDLSTPAY